MKSTVFVLAWVLSLNASFAFADNGTSLWTAPLQKGETYFSRLKDIYQQGFTPALSTLQKGWYTGRCYYDNHQDIPKAGLLVLDEKDITSPTPPDNGPLFPAPAPVVTHHTLLQRVSYDAAAPNYFDSDTAHWAESTRLLLSDADYYDVREQADSLIAEAPNQSWAAASFFMIRQYQSYWIAEIHVAGLTADHDSEMCYFFKKVN